MEGPSLFLAAEWLSPFVGKKILTVKGNTHVGKERLKGKTVHTVFSWGKHLVFQFDDCALRVHFLLFGTFEAVFKGQKITGDYPKKKANPRLLLKFKDGEIVFYNCSLKFLESSQARNLYDFSTDVMSTKWNSAQAFRALKKLPNVEIADALLDQGIFSGVGNIIKNEVLFIVKKRPERIIKSLSDTFLKNLIQCVCDFSHRFYAWRKKFVLKKHYQIYRKSLCPICHTKVCRKKTGKRQRISFFCPHCQK